MSSTTLTGNCSQLGETLVIQGDTAPAIHADLLPGHVDDAVLIVPGFWRTRSDPVMKRVSARIHSVGPSVCTIDHRGHGDSAGTFGFNTHESDDVIRTLEALAARISGFRRACILGFSAGGSIAISVAARRPDLVRGLVLISPVADFKRVIPRPNPFRMQRHISLRSAVRPPRFWWHERLHRDTLTDARRVTTPVCMIHARNDWLVHHSHSERIAESLPTRPELHLLDFDRIHGERLLDVPGAPWTLVSDFMRESLGMWLGTA